MAETDRVSVLESRLEERHALYTTRFTEAKTAVDAALAANKELTTAAFAASEKAIQKAEANAEKWRENANEWRSAMVDREQKFAGRAEIDARFETISATVASLKETRAEGLGGKLFKDDSRATIAMVLSVIGLLVVLFEMFKK